MSRQPANRRWLCGSGCEGTHCKQNVYKKKKDIKKKVYVGSKIKEEREIEIEGNIDRKLEGIYGKSNQLFK